MDFHETAYGRVFFNSQLPQLIRVLGELSKSIRDARQSLSKGTAINPDFLHDLYFGDYEPLVFKEQSGELKELNRRVSDAEHSLRQVLSGTPDLLLAFDVYQRAADERGSAVTEQAFESGYQTAINMLVAGLVTPQDGKNEELPLTTQELRKMNGETVYCLELNEEAQVVAYKRGFIHISTEREIYLVNGLTLFRRRPAGC